MGRFVFSHLFLTATVLGGVYLYAKRGPQRHREVVGRTAGLLLGQQAGALAGLVVAGPAGMLVGGMAGGIGGAVIGNEMMEPRALPAAPGAETSS